MADKEGNLQEGDLIQKINNISLDGLSLKDARKLLDSAKDKLDLLVKRDPYKSSASNRNSPTQAKVENTQVNEERNNLAANQNLYVPPPSRKDEKNNLARADQLQKEETSDTGQPPPRPPLPRDEGKFPQTTLKIITRQRCISIIVSHRNNLNSVSLTTVKTNLEPGFQISCCIHSDLSGSTRKFIKESWLG